MVLTIFHFKPTRFRKQLIKPIVESSYNFEALNALCSRIIMVFNICPIVIIN